MKTIARRKHFLFLAWIVFPFLAMAQQPARKMNIIYILADDHRYVARPAQMPGFRLLTF